MTAEIRCSVIKLYTDLDNKETMRIIMKEAESKLQLDEFIAETEFYSLPLPARKKTLTRQNEYTAKYQTVFITGFKDVDKNLTSDRNRSPVCVTIEVQQ